MSFDRCRNPKGVADVCVHIVIVMVVVASEIILHCLTTVNEEVVMGIIVATPVVVVNILLWRIIVNEEIVMDFAPLHDHRRLACANVRQERWPVPRIEWAMVSAL